MNIEFSKNRPFGYCEYSEYSKKFLKVDFTFTFFLTSYRKKEMVFFLMREDFAIHSYNCELIDNETPLKLTVNCWTYIRSENFQIIQKCCMDFNNLILNIKNPNEEIQWFCKFILDLELLEKGKSNLYEE